MADETNGNGLDLKRKVAEEAIRQGPAFLLLCAVLWFMRDGLLYCVDQAIPTHFARIQAGYDAIEERQDERFRIVAEHYRNDQAAIVECQRQVTACLEEMRDANGALRRLVENDRRVGTTQPK